MNTINITTVLISEDEWRGIEETLYLLSIPGLVDSINDIRLKEVWEEAKEYDPNENW